MCLYMYICDIIMILSYLCYEAKTGHPMIFFLFLVPNYTKSGKPSILYTYEGHVTHV